MEKKLDNETEAAIHGVVYNDCVGEGPKSSPRSCCGLSEVRCHTLTNSPVQPCT